MEKESYIYPGSVENFKAMMAYLRDNNREGWVASTGERLHWRPEPTKETSSTATWRVSGSGGRGIIEVWEMHDHTVVTFEDGCGLENYTYRKIPATSIGPSFRELIQMIAEVGEMKAIPVPTEGGVDKRRPPTPKTQERAKVFKRLKDAHPEWNYDRVAMEAVEELGEVVTGESVRNAYRAMREAYPDKAEEWTWKRADRIR